MAEKPHKNSCNSVMHLSSTEEPVIHRDRGNSMHRAQGLMAARTTTLQRSSLQQEILEFMKMLRNFHLVLLSHFISKDIHFLGDTDPVWEGAQGHAVGVPFQDCPALVAAQTLSSLHVQHGHQQGQSLHGMETTHSRVLVHRQTPANGSSPQPTHPPGAHVSPT
ncbi:putative uncharacterized protein C8orf31 [Sapajus apella]|uniref:Uncharacterized protein n=1 Tax=Sapajus apella TaxID=9515 RepID=A0A6J3I9R9_SAPAP|nr:putative uncharacterized protein C8orf31 [Sapajus apella]